MREREVPNEHANIQSAERDLCIALRRLVYDKMFFNEFYHALGIVFVISILAREMHFHWDANMLGKIDDIIH